MRDDETTSFEDALLKELRLLRDELGVPPRTIDMGKHGRFSPGVYSTEFGSWKEALERAGVEGEPSRPPDDAEVNIDGRSERGDGGNRCPPAEEGAEEITVPRREPEGNTDSLDEHARLLLRHSERTGSVPTPDDIRRQGESVNEIVEEHGTWEKALASAGIDVPESEHASPVSDGQARGRRGSEGRRERLLDEMRKYEGVHGKLPTESEIEATEWMGSVGEYTEEFGGVWRAADRLREERSTQADDANPENKDELTRELKLYYLRNGEAPTREDVKENDTLSVLSDYIDAFGDLRTAVESSGVTDRDGG